MYELECFSLECHSGEKFSYAVHTMFIFSARNIFVMISSERVLRKVCFVFL